MRWLIAILLLVGLPTDLFAHNVSGDELAKPFALNATIQSSNSTVEAERRNAILEARSELENKAYSRLEILSALFALLITILVVAFGFRTEKAAARAAKGELADRQRELDEIMTSARDAGKAAEEASTAALTASAAAQTHATSAADHSARAAENAEAIRQAATNVERPKPSIAESEEQRKVAQDAASTPRNQLSAEELSALLQKAFDEDRWDDVVELSQGLRFLYGDAPEYLTNSLFMEAYAVGRLRKHQEEVDLYSRLISEVEASEDPAIQQRVAWARFNKSLAYLLLKQPSDAVGGLNQVINIYGKKGDEFKDTFSGALFWKAQALAELGNIGDAIVTLEDWRNTDGFSCDKIKDSAFFLAYLDDKRFKKFMEDSGCS